MLSVDCLHGERKVMKVSSLGVFEIRKGCSARSPEWIFPTYMEGKTDVAVAVLTFLNIRHGYETATCDP